MGCFQAVARESITWSYPQFEVGAAYFAAAEESPPSDFCLPDGDQALSRAGPISRAPHLVAASVGGAAGRSWSRTCHPPKAEAEPRKRAKPEKDLKKKKKKNMFTNQVHLLWELVWASLSCALIFSRPWHHSSWRQEMHLHISALKLPWLCNTEMPNSKCTQSPVPTALP